MNRTWTEKFCSPVGVTQHWAGEGVVKRLLAKEVQLAHHLAPRCSEVGLEQEIGKRSEPVDHECQSWGPCRATHLCE